MTGTSFRSVSDELLSSFQLLLGAVDLCFKNALVCDHRTGLLNPQFPGMFLWFFACVIVSVNKNLQRVLRTACFSISQKFCTIHEELPGMIHN